MYQLGYLFKSYNIFSLYHSKVYTYILTATFSCSSVQGY